MSEDHLIPHKLDHIATFTVNGQVIEMAQMSNKVVGYNVIVECSCGEWRGEFVAPDRLQDMVPLAKGEFALHQHEMYGYREVS